jgi:hypothetical protein
LKIPAGTTFNNVGFTPTPALAGTAVTGDQTTGPYLRQATDGTSGNVASILSGDTNQCFPSWQPMFEWNGRTFGNVSDIRLWRGLRDSDLTASTDPTSARSIGFRFDTGAGDTTWKAYVSNGTSSTVRDTGIAVATATVYRLALEVLPSGEVDYWVDGIRRVRMVTGDNIPTAPLLGWGVTITALAAANKSQMTSSITLEY